MAARTTMRRSVCYLARVSLVAACARGRQPSIESPGGSYVSLLRYGQCYLGKYGFDIDWHELPREGTECMPFWRSADSLTILVKVVVSRAREEMFRYWDPRSGI